jgi:hypothetical protein
VLKPDAALGIHTGTKEPHGLTVWPQPSRHSSSVTQATWMSTISTRFIRESLGRIIRLSTLTSLIVGSPRSTPVMSHKNTKQVKAPFASRRRIG